MIKESSTLFFREGSSDKVYQASIEEKDGGFVVTCAYGRRGSTMQTGVKTASPTTYEKAKKIYDKLIQEKTSKGYTPGEDGTPYVGTSEEKKDTGIRCQLLNAIDEDELKSCLEDNYLWGQVKYDGKRMLLRKVGDEVVAINRRGLECGMPQEIHTAAKLIDIDCVIDGEAVGTTFFVFDLLSRDGIDVRKEPYESRYSLLAGIIPNGVPALQIAPVARGQVAKNALLSALKKANGEGIVFKDKHASYTAGRPSSGGPALKYKFTATCSCLVIDRNPDKRSVQIGLFGADNKPVAVGNCTIPPNAEIPTRGDIIELRYLYGIPKGSLFQPVFLRKRDDISLSECTLSQIKLKGGDQDEDNDP